MGEEYYIVGSADCVFCGRATALLGSLGRPYRYDDVSTSQFAMDELKALGTNTVPQIWVGSRHIGGYTELLTELMEK